MRSKGFRKRMAIALSVAMVTGLAPANVWQPVNGTKIAVVHAEDTDSSVSATTKAQVRMDYREQKIFVCNVDGLELEDVFYYQFVNDKNGQQVDPSASKWNTAVVDSLTELGEGESKVDAQCMDMSWLSTTKPQTLYVTFNTDPAIEKPATIHIPAQVTKLKIDFTGSKPSDGTENKTYIGNDVTGYLTINASKTDQSVTSFEQLDWRSTNGTWQNVIQDGACNLNLLRYINKGGALEFRVKPTDTEPAGKAVKFKYVANAKGPKITVDNVKQTVSFPAGCEYILASEYQVGATWTSVTAKTTKYFDELCGYTGEADVTIFVRNAGALKKASSKNTVVVLKAAEETPAETVLVDSKGEVQSTGKLAVTYTNANDVTKGLTISNNTQKKYQVAVVKKTELDGKDLTKGSSLKIGDRTSAAFVFKDVKVGGSLRSAVIGAKWKDKITAENGLQDYVLLVRTGTGLEPGKILSVDLMAKSESGEEGVEPVISNSDGTKIDSMLLEWNYEDESVRVPFGNNTIIYYEFATSEKEPKQWEAIYEKDGLQVTKGGKTINYAVIDFSNLNPAKDNWLYLKGDADTEVVFVKRDKASALKATFKANSAGLTAEQKNFCETYTSFTDETGYYIFQADGVEMTNGSSIYWKTENGSWSSLKDLDLTLFKYKATKLYFRIQADERLNSKSVRVTYAGKAKGTTVKVDGDKLTVALTNKMQYKVRVADGSFSEWITPELGGKNSAKVSLTTLKGMSGNGNGVSTQWQDTTLLVRTAATSSKIPSNASAVNIYAPEQPECGSEGLSVAYVDSTNPEKGMKFTNKTKYAYQVAMIDGGCDEDAAVESINLAATAKDIGYVKFINVKAGGSATCAYNTYRNYVLPVAICRIATVKENTKTSATEFRIASMIQLVNGASPICNLKSGVIKIDADQTSATEQVSFDIAEGWKVYYTVNGSAPSVSSAKDTVTGTKYTVPFNVTVQNGEKVVIQAMGVKLDNLGHVEKEGGKLTIVLTGYKPGDNGAYKDRWGYKLCLEDDLTNNNTISSSLYAMMYDAIVNQQAEIDVSSLNIPASDVGMLSVISERLRYDNPQLIQYGGRMGYSYGTIVNKLTIQYNQDSETTTKMMSEVEQTYQKIVALALQYGNATTLTNVSDEQKVKAIHDYLVLNNVYQSSKYDQNIYGAMSETATPVCMSYAMSMEYCCQRMGIECVLVVGDVGGAHAWNLIRLDNGDSKDDSDDWYEIDVTWDDPVGGDPDKVYTSYFNVTTDQLNASKTRTRSTQAYTRYPVEKATGTLYSAASLYNNYETTITYGQIEDLVNYRCGLELPEIVEE